MFGIFEVFMDTIVICTLTALVILCSGATMAIPNLIALFLLSGVVAKLVKENVDK